MLFSSLLIKSFSSHTAKAFTERIVQIREKGKGNFAPAWDGTARNRPDPTPRRDALRTSRLICLDICSQVKYNNGRQYCGRNAAQGM